MVFAFELGSKARDIVTGFEGIIVSRIEYINGCIQYGVGPKIDKDGKMVSSEYIDEQRLEIVGEGVDIVADTLVGGDSPDKPSGNCFD